MEKVSIILLAAGFGSRMQSSLPKAMHKIGNTTLIEHILAKAKNLNVHEVICVVSDNMLKYVNNIPNVKVVCQKERKGTAHAVLTAKNAVDKTSDVLLVLYADTPFIEEEDLQKILNLVENQDAVISVLGFNKMDQNNYGRLILDSSNNITAIKEVSSISDQKELKELHLCNSGVMAINAKYGWSLLEQIDNKNNKAEYYLTDIIKHANDQNLLCKYILSKEETLLGINNKVELAHAEQIFQDKMREKFMLQGVTMLDPKTVYFSLDTDIEKDVTIYPNVYFYSKVKIKQGSNIYPNCVLEGVTIGKNCNIGPFARIRPETEIKNNVKIGNFVEVKKSYIDTMSKISHLSYIGDSKIGTNCNIGAGVITCNYDGKLKHETKIGNNVSVGSNSALIAPVKICDNATIAASTTVVEDVESFALAISRCRQLNKKNWVKKTLLPNNI